MAQPDDVEPVVDGDIVDKVNGPNQPDLQPTPDDPVLEDIRKN